jgi:hypothetical protein
MIIPAWLIAVLALVYSVEYVHRFLRLQHNYIYLGKALGRLILAIVYVYITLTNPPDSEKIIWVRWSLLMLLSTDLFYIAQEHLMRTKLQKK